VFPAEQAAAFQANDLQVIEKGAPMEFEELALRKTGRTRVLSTSFPSWTPKEKYDAIGGVAIDIN